MYSGTDKDPLASLQSILRISPEPNRVVPEAEVHALLSDRPTQYLQFILDALHGIAAGRTQLELPPKQIFSDPGDGGDFRVMPCVTRTAARITKTVKLVGTNLRQRTVPDQITVGRAYALDPDENFITHSFEACLLSSARTGLCAALGRELLSRGEDSVGIIGAGRVGWYAGYYVCAVRPPRQVRIHDCDPQRATALAAQLQSRYPHVAVSAAGAVTVRDADTLILATTSREPLLHPQDTSARLIISLGADTDDQSELADDWAATARICVDTLDSARFGDLRRWMDKGLLEIGSMTDLFMLLRDFGATDVTTIAARPAAFISTGSALFDNLTIAYLLERLRKG